MAPARQYRGGCGERRTRSRADRELRSAPRTYFSPIRLRPAPSDLEDIAVLVNEVRPRSGCPTLKAPIYRPALSFPLASSSPPHRGMSRRSSSADAWTRHGQTAFSSGARQAPAGDDATRHHPPAHTGRAGHHQGDRPSRSSRSERQLWLTSRPSGRRRRLRGQSPRPRRPRRWRTRPRQPWRRTSASREHGTSWSPRCP